MEKVLYPSLAHTTDAETYRIQALALLENQNTLTLAVIAENHPWIAPVYFVYIRPGLYFFSSPASKHIQALQGCQSVAGAVYADSDHWQDLQGLQMTGHVDRIQGRIERLSATARYLVKFPQARDLLTFGTDTIRDLGQKVGLFVFRPAEIHCTNNRLGFGRRVQIRL